MGQLEETVFVKPEKRTFENRSKRKIVLGLKQRIAEREQIHDGELLNERHTVCASDRNTFAFQRGLEKACHRLALAQQDQDIAGFDGAPAGGKTFATFEPVLDLCGDPRRKGLS